MGVEVGDVDGVEGTECSVGEIISVEAIGYEADVVVGGGVECTSGCAGSIPLPLDGDVGSNQSSIGSLCCRTGGET